MKKRWYGKALTWQLLLAILLALILLIAQHNLLNLLSIAISLLSFILLYKGNERVSHVFDIIFLPAVLLFVYSNFFSFLINSFSNLNIILYVLYFIGMLVVLLPITIRDFCSLERPIWQLIASIWVIVSLFLSPLIEINSSQFIVGLNKSDLLLALIFLEYAYFAITGWGYKFYLNLKVKNTNTLYYIMLLVLLAVTAWISFFNIFILSASEWSQALWNWDFSLIKPADSATVKNIWQLIFSALDAGIMEESARYIFLLALLVMLTKKKGQAIYSVLLSSVIFSLLHIFNFSTPGTTINAVLFQILHAFGFGCLLGVILLYSGKLWLTVLLHAFADFLSLSLVPLGYGGSLLDNENTGTLTLVVVTVIPLIFVTIILLNKSAKRYIDKNIKKYIEF